MRFKNFFLIFLLLPGCARISYRCDSISQCVTQKIGKEVVWNSAPDPICQEWICETLQYPLSLDDAVQIALLNNPKIQEFYEEIGIAQADLLQARLFHNPVFESFYRIPNKAHLCLNLGFSLAQNLLDFLLVPLKKKIAAAELARVEYDVGDAILDLTFEVERTFHALVFESVKLQKVVWILELTEAKKEIALDQMRAGSIYILDFEKHDVELARVKLMYQESALKIETLKADLAILLGLKGTCWDLAWVQPACLPCLPDLCALQTCALQSRFDLQAAYWEIEKIVRTGAIKNWWAYTDLMGGISTEREVECTWQTGPAFSVAIPLFDYGQADRMRLFAEFQQSIAALKSLRIEIFADVEKHYSNLITLENMLQQYHELLPIYGSITEESQKLYNVMSLGVYDLIEAKIDEYQTEIDYLKTQRDFWITYVNLKEALGGCV